MARLTARPKNVQKLLDSWGDVNVIAVSVCRAPIIRIFEKMLNIATFGKLKKKMAAMHYDSLYHLYLVIRLATGQTYSIEKNSRVKIIEGKKSGNAECREETLLNVPLRTFWEKAEAAGLTYRYSAHTDNCQKFVRKLLNANGIEKYNAFVSQSTKDLLPSYLKKITSFVTDTASLADNFYRGGGTGGKRRSLKLRLSNRKTSNYNRRF